ncbi:MAG: N-acylglucosamine 2-epimerase [Clostridiales bacterium]|nr:N-acylglucosamine 2-epimerase [Clostridiales bacterium]
MVIKEVKEHLINNLLPFWMRLKDDRHGGFYGEMSYDLKQNHQAVKGGIYHSRILWFFSNACLTLNDKKYLDYADHAYEFIRNRFVDKEFGGIYWTVNYDGKPHDDSKHTYNQAFAVYALASYFDASGNPEALALAYDIFNKIETLCKDEDGYLEALDRGYNPVSNEKLSENGVMASRTMNTLLHLIEAYTELYRVDGNETVAACIRKMLDMLVEKVYNPTLRRLDVFFDMEWKSLIDLHSYGHDIEASWLIDRACEVIGDTDCTKRISVITKDLANHVHQVALDNGSSVYYECENGIVDTKKVWWVQAEAILGFVNGYQKNPLRTDYLDTAGRIWTYIKQNIIDKREGSEWFNELHKDGSPIKDMEIAGLWKCPYHNGRMCFELINRKIEMKYRLGEA